MCKLGLKTGWLKTGESQLKIGKRNENRLKTGWNLMKIGRKWMKNGFKKTG